MLRLIVAILIALVLSAPFIQAASVTVHGWCASAEEWELLGYVNEERARVGVAPLLMSQTLGAAAEHHSKDMARNNYFSHTLANGTTWSQNITNHGYSYTTYRAENLAAGYSTALKTFIQWKNSPGHYANMVSPRYKAIGVGAFTDTTSTYDVYWTQTFGGIFDRAATTDCPIVAAVNNSEPVEDNPAELIEAVSEEPAGGLPSTGSGSGQ